MSIIVHFFTHSFKRQNPRHLKLPVATISSFKRLSPHSPIPAWSAGLQAVNQSPSSSSRFPNHSIISVTTPSPNPGSSYPRQRREKGQVHRIVATNSWGLVNACCEWDLVGHVRPELARPYWQLTSALSKKRTTLRQQNVANKFWPCWPKIWSIFQM